MTAVLGAILLFADKPLLSLFLGSGSPSLPIGERIQLICTGAYLVMSVTMILSGTMRAYGAVVVPLAIMAIALFPARLGFYYLAYPVIGGNAIWWAFPIGSVTSLLLTSAYYLRGQWRQAYAG